ncbi:hypothetical protein THAOC_20334, partial [Thalassiosira oceanica]
ELCPPWAASTTALRGGRSTRLSPWILDPQPAALPSSSSAHLSLPPPSGPSVLVVNAGGLHLFRGRTDLDSLSSALPRAGGSVRDDASVRSYFDERGGTEAAASCLALAATSPDPRVRARAADAAFANARRAAPAPGRADGALEFRPSSLYDGLVRAAGRLLRPVWHRPPVVVTEGVPVRARGVLANSREGRAAPRRRRAPRGPVPARGAEGPDEEEVRPRRVVRARRAVGGPGG